MNISLLGRAMTHNQLLPKEAHFFGGFVFWRAGGFVFSTFREQQ